MELYNQTMSFLYQKRTLDSPFVGVVWRTEDTSDGVYLAAADGAWDLLFTYRDGDTDVRLSGPSSRVTPFQYQTGNRNLGIRFKPGSFMTGLPARNMLDTTIVLPKARANAFWFGSKVLEVPTFENAHQFIVKLANQDLLAQDAVVDSQVRGEKIKLTSRSVQRHFLYATGLSPGHHQQIKRAAKAVKLLEEGLDILQVVHVLGFTDQPHMTRALKRFSGCTPGEIVRRTEQAHKMHAIQRYGACAEMGVINFKGGTYADLVPNPHSLAF